MAAATIRMSNYGASASEPAGATAEGGISWNTENTLTGTSPIAVPTATGTNYSYIKNLALEVTGTGTTTISNGRVSWATSPATGLTGHFKGTATYANPASGNQPASAGTNGATPATYTLLTTTPQVYDSGSAATSSTGRKLNFCVVVVGLDNTYAGGPGSANAAPNLVLTYDEA